MKQASENPQLRSRAASHYEELARIGRAMSNPMRLRLLDLLRQGPRSVEVIAEASGLSVANASQHLRRLKAARLVETEKRGQQVVYRLADEIVSLLFAATRDVAELLLPEMDRLKADLQVQEEDDRALLLEKVLQGKVTLVDVRPADEYRAGHVSGAISIPLNELSARLADLPRSKEIVAYCRGPYCSMALEAVALLEAAGFKARHLDLGAPDLSARRWKLDVVEGEKKEPNTRSRRKS